jgi:hypothetical protein
MNENNKTVETTTLRARRLNKKNERNVMDLTLSIEVTLINKL